MKCKVLQWSDAIQHIIMSRTMKNRWKRFICAINEFQEESSIIGVDLYQIDAYSEMIYNMIFFRSFCYTNSKDMQ